MEATMLKNIEHDNKENILVNIPSSFTKETNVPILEKTRKDPAPVVKRRLRRPLQDITHLFVNTLLQPVQLSSAALFADFGLDSLVSSPAAAVNCRKRKTASGDDIDSIRKTASKILRKEFR